MIGITLNKQQLEYGKEKNLVVDKIIGLKLKINELIINHGRKSSEVEEGRDSITSPGKSLLPFLLCSVSLSFGN